VVLTRVPKVAQASHDVNPSIENADDYAFDSRCDDVTSFDADSKRECPFFCIVICPLASNLIAMTMGERVTHARVPSKAKHCWPAAHAPMVSAVQLPSLRKLARWSRSERRIISSHAL
jgi:hypothetical protein